MMSNIYAIIAWYFQSSDYSRQSAFKKYNEVTKLILFGIFNAKREKKKSSFFQSEYI